MCAYFDGSVENSGGKSHLYPFRHLLLFPIAAGGLDLVDKSTMSSLRRGRVYSVVHDAWGPIAHQDVITILRVSGGALTRFCAFLGREESRASTDYLCEQPC